MTVKAYPTKTCVIYSKQCPACGQFNLPDTLECWNCHYQFPRSKEKRESFSTVEKVLIGLTVLMVGIVAVLRVLVS